MQSLKILLFHSWTFSSETAGMIVIGIEVSTNVNFNPSVSRVLALEWDSDDYIVKVHSLKTLTSVPGSLH